MTKIKILEINVVPTDYDERKAFKLVVTYQWTTTVQLLSHKRKFVGLLYRYVKRNVCMCVWKTVIYCAVVGPTFGHQI